MELNKAEIQEIKKKIKREFTENDQFALKNKEDERYNKILEDTQKTVNQLKNVDLKESVSAEVFSKITVFIALLVLQLI